MTSDKLCLFPPLYNVDNGNNLKGVVCIKWDNPCKTLSTVPSTLVFIKCHHSLIPTDTRTFRASDHDSKRSVLHFISPNASTSSWKRVHFKVFPQQIYLVQVIPCIPCPWIFFTDIEKNTIYSHIFVEKKPPYMNRVCPGPGGQEKSWVCHLFVMADITIIIFWFKWRWEQQ